MGAQRGSRRIRGVIALRDPRAIRYNFHLCAACRNDAENALRQALGVPRGARRGRRHHAALHRSPPGARSHQSPGVRGDQARAAQALARIGQSRGGRPQRSDHRPLRRDLGSRVTPAGRDARCELRGIRNRRVQDERRPPGHRARDRPGAGRDAARHDGGVRRLAHQHSRRVRLPRFRNRHLGSRARACDAVPAREEDEEHARAHRGAACARGRGEGCGACRDRQDRHRGGHRKHHRIRRQHGSLPYDGRPHDPVQHVDRGRSARRHDSGRRRDDRLPERQAVCAAGRAVGPRSGALAHAAERSGRQVRPRGGDRCAIDQAAGDVGHLPRDGGDRRRARSRPREGEGRRPPRGHGEGARVHGLEAEYPDDRHPHRQSVHRVVHQFAHRGPAGRRGDRARTAHRLERQARPGRAGLRTGEGAGGNRGSRPRLQGRRFRVA